MKIRIAVGATEHSSDISHKEVRWEQIVSKYSKHTECRKKGGEYVVGGFFSCATRKEIFMLGRSLLVVDIDKFKGTIADLEFALGLLDYKFVAYSSFRHTNALPRIRLIIPLSRNVTPEEYRVLALQACRDLPIPFEAIDACSWKPNQPMFAPQHPPGGEFWTMAQDGAAYEVPGAFEERPVVLGAEASDLDALVAAQPLDLSDEQVSAYLAAYPASGLDYGGWLAVGMALHHQFAGSPEGFALWLDWSALDEGRFDADVTEAKWASFKVGSKPVTMASVIHAVNESGVVVSTRKTWLDRIAECDDKHVLEKLVMQKIAKDKTIGPVDLADIKAAVKEKFHALGVKILTEPLNKMFKPIVKRMLPDIGSNELPLETIDNLVAVCNNNNVQVRYNVIKKDDEILIADAKWSVDNAKSASITWLRSACHKVEMRTTNIKNFVTLLADRNQFNPVVEWVTSEPWDGVSRLDEFYATVRENPDECSEKMKRTVMLRWMVGAIAAAFSPSGVMVRGVLVFQGEQYTGKTRWIDALAPKEKELVKTGRSLLVHDKDSVKQILSCWISELGELDATFKKSDIAALKAFITSDMDEMRRPYAIAESQYVRRTVFAASVNEPKFLQDDTGNSRFWVLPIISVDHAHKLDMQQVWAEIHALWDEGRGEKHYLSKEEMELLNCHNETFAAPDPIFEMIRGHLDWDNFHLDTCEWKQVSDVLRWLGHNIPSRYDTILAGKAIKKLNYGHSKKTNGVRLVAVPACKILQVEGELTFK